MAEIDTIISNSRSYADSTISEAKYWIEKFAAVDDLVNNLSFVDDLPLQTYSELIDLAKELKTIVDREIPSRPSGLGSIDMPTTPSIAPVDTNSIRQALSEIIDIINSIPDTLSSAIVMYEAVNSKILEDLTLGSYGIETADENALWQRARDRELEILDIEIEEATDQHASYGMPIPQGAYSKLVEKLAWKTQKALSDLNKEITIKRADLYRTTREFTIDRSIEIAKTGFGLTEAKVKFITDTAMASINTVRLELDQYRMLLDKYGYDLDSVMKEQSMLSDIYRNDIASYSARMGAIGHAYSVLQSASSDQLQADRAFVDEGMQKAKAQIEAFSTIGNIKINEMHAIANVLMQKVNGALSGLNAMVAKIETEQLG